MDIEEHLRLLNRWWAEGRVGEGLARAYRRECFNEIFNTFMKYRQAVVLSGLRRVGKSTIMFQVIDELIRQGVRPINIVYFTMDLLPVSGPGVSLVDVLNAYKRITGVEWKSETVYLFIDEAQRNRDWGNEVKIIYDAFPNVRLMISGSASLNLERTAMEALAGRHFLYEIPVLSLLEYYSIRHGVSVKNPRLIEEDILAEAEGYIRKPFPELAAVDDFVKVSEYIREAVISKIVGTDLVAEFGRASPALLHSLIELFYSEPGMTLNVDSISRALGRRKEDIEAHIYMLEYSKLIRVVRNYRPSAMSESRKLRKVYPYDISLALAYNSSLEAGKVAEALVISRLNVKRYWKEGSYEVDGVLDDGTPLEVKASSSVGEGDLRGLRRYIERYGAKEGILVYNGSEFKREGVRGVNLHKMLLYGLSR